MTKRFEPADGLEPPAILPRLVAFTHEDRAAKGLRVFSEEKTEPEPAVQFTAVEMVSMHRAQLLHAPRGGGKTTLAKAFCNALMGERAGNSTENLASLCRPAVRNPDGLLLPQLWEIGVPLSRMSTPGSGRKALSNAETAEQPVLLILDGLEREADPSALVRDAMDWCNRNENARLLILCETGALENIRLHPDLRVQALLPLPRAERAAVLERLGAVDPVAAEWAHPGLWALSLAEGKDLDLAAAAALPSAADWLREPRDKLELAALSPERVVERVQNDPARWSGPLRLLVADMSPDNAIPLAKALSRSGSLPLLLSAADLLRGNADALPGLADQITQALTTPGTFAALRRRAGEALARLGDPRDLERLLDVPAGDYEMGGELHPNSAPAHKVALPGFRIGMFPVTCGAYLRFVTETGRAWSSANGRLPERSNHPATDLTWHDARAYCAWLTARWRSEQRLGPDETVRLPTEREWEAAARGPDGLRYPWGEDWAPEHANDEETGFNDLCAVGLFPEGASPFGCLDMAGQAWEWCTTLWGADMASPSFRFPWDDDGREALDAAPEIRRVLRGGCFSSGRAKANGVYRGSLEPNGFWRGNGFRIVVAE